MVRSADQNRRYRVTATDPDGAIMMDTIRTGIQAVARLIDHMRGRVDLADCVFRAEACV